MKSNKPGITLLHYLAEFIQKNFPNDADWCQELGHLEAASQLTVSQLQTDVQVMAAKLEKLIKDMQASDDSGDYPKFYTLMQDFSTRAAYEVDKLREALSRVEELAQSVTKSFPNKDDSTVEDIIRSTFEFCQAYQAAVDETKKRVDLEEKKRALAEKKAKLEALKAEKSGIASPPVEQKSEVPTKSVDELKDERNRRRAARARGEKGGGILDSLLDSMKNGNFDSFVEQI